MTDLTYAAKLDQSWYSHADELIAFFAEHRRWPEHRVPAEVPLASWLNDSRRSARGVSRRPLSAERIAYLNEHLPHWREPNAARWFPRADEVIAFYIEHGRTPYQTAKDPVERRMGLWIRDVRVNARTSDKGILTTPTQQKYLDEHIPGWRGHTKQQAWKALLDEAVAYVAQHGDLPTEETRAGAWIGRARRNQGNPEWAKRVTELDDRLPGWRHPKPIRQFIETANEVAAFVNTNGHTPRDSARVSARERDLGVWLHRQRQLTRSGELLDGRVELLNSLLPENWSATPDTKSPKWFAKAYAIAEFYKVNGRFPRQRPANMEDHLEEHRLGTALNGMRQAAKGKGRKARSFTAERRQFLDQLMPGWDGPLNPNNV